MDGGECTVVAVVWFGVVLSIGAGMCCCCSRVCVVLFDSGELYGETWGQG
jgi:hypothetical protein